MNIWILEDDQVRINGKCLWQYNGKKFLTIDDAKRNADFIAFKLYNGEKI